MPSGATFYEFFYQCGLPTASPDERSAWNVLKTGATGVAKLSVGLFGYDIGCINEICEILDFQEAADSDGNSWSYCAALRANHHDGLAMGAYFYVPDHSDNYCAGFRNTDSGNSTNNTFVCFYAFNSQQYVGTVALGYQVDADFFTNLPDWDEYDVYPGSGFSPILWGFNYDVDAATDYWNGFMYRFITATENHGNRWASGDAIDMFLLDFHNSEYADNAAFELLGATELAVSGAVALISAVLM